MFTNGAIEMSPGGSSCLRVPDILYHLAQFKGQAEIPNYGINQTVGSIYKEIHGRATYGSGQFEDSPFENYPGPYILMHNFLGDCFRSQILMAIPKGNDSVVQLYCDYGPNVSNEPYLNFYVDYKPIGNYYQMEYFAYQQDGNFVNTHNVVNSAYVDPGTGGLDDRTTALMEIDPSYGIDGYGPDQGYYYQPGGWLSILNGLVVSSDSSQFGFYGQTEDGPPLSCETLFRNSPGVLVVDNEMLGFAVFRGGDQFTIDEYNCWHKEYDWFSDPGFI